MRQDEMEKLIWRGVNFRVRVALRSASETEADVQQARLHIPILQPESQLHVSNNLEMLIIYRRVQIGRAHV